MNYSKTFKLLNLDIKINFLKKIIYICPYFANMKPLDQSNSILTYYISWTWFGK